MLSIIAYLSAFTALISGTLASPIERRAISTALLAEFNLFEQYAAAAYCPNNNNSPGTKLTCPTSNNCPLVEAATTVTTDEFQNSLVTDVTGYVAVDSTNHLIVVAFRGTESVRNYAADADFPVVATDICSGCTADQGFYNSWLEARAGVIASVQAAAKANPSYSIVATGHSLGAAIADFAAAELRNQGYSVALYTFGSPRIGGAEISSYITSQPGGNYRITHFDDPVPRLPPILLGFVHISPEYWITTGNEVAVTAQDINGPLTGSVNFAGNTGTTGFDLTAHGWYFNNISSCYPGGFEFKN
ncbi:MAG: hypothetical protein M1827_003361 [Pycnora praestabilis]|nr:MAG: hypothetical protein M1827_003361 [Pycnora praestabilis]